MCYQDPTTHTVVDYSSVVYPRAHLHREITEHYIDFLQTQTRGGSG